MTYTTKDGVTILIDTPEGEKKEARYSHPSFVRACRNNENIASVLDYFVYAASKEAKDRGYPATERKIKVTRKHEHILQSLSHKISRKSLIRYLDSLNEWKMVLSQSYQRDFIVDLDVIQETLKNPPQLPPRTKHSEGLQEKGGQVTTLQPFEKVDKLQRSEVEELRQKVDKLQHKVDTFQRESGQVSTFCGQVSTLQRDFDALKELVQGLLSGSPIITSNILPIDTNKDIVARRNNALTFTLLTEEDFQDIEKALVKNALPTQGSDQNPNPNITTTGQNDTPLTPTGSITAAEGGNHHADADNMVPDHTAIPEPPCSATDGLTESQGVNVPPTPTKPSEFALQTQEMPSSTQGVDESNRQATEQGNGDDHIANGTIENSPSQQTLIEKPKQPLMPPASMKWCPEKLVQITEARRYCDNKQGAYFSEQLQGKSKKTQRQRQLEAARKIIALDITEDRYLKAYDDRNDDWWNETKGSLTVESMIANNKESVPRILAVLEKLESRGSTKKPRNNVTPMRPINNPPAGQEPTPEKVAKIDAIQERLAKMQQPKQAVI